MPRGQPSKVGERTVSANGYTYEKTEAKWKLVHHIIAEEVLGRPLGKNELAKFKNGDRKDLRPENIIVVRKGSNKSPQARLAIVEAQIADLVAERDIIRQEIKEATND